jgi:hypothetical protein
LTPSYWGTTAPTITQNSSVLFLILLFIFLFLLCASRLSTRQSKVDSTLAPGCPSSR